MGSNWAKIAEYWADPKAHPEVVDAFRHLKRPNGAIPPALRIPTATIPTPGLMNMFIFPSPDSGYFRPTCSTTDRTNVASYPKWGQAWLHDHKPPTLVAWGANDPSFTAPGAEAFNLICPCRDPSVRCGPFALDEKTDEIAHLIRDFTRDTLAD